MIMNCANIVALAQGIQALSTRGLIPAELHVNAKMREMMVNGLIGLGKMNPTLRGTELKRFCGVPVVVNDQVPDFGLVIRPMNLMGDPDWLKTMAEESRLLAAAKALDARPNVAMAEVGSENEEDEGEAETVSSDDFRNPHPKSVTDVLVEAMTDCDNLRGVAVIGVEGQNNISIRTNFSKIELFGLLQIATQKVACGE